MYTSYYGLDEKPFALVPDPRYLFLASSHREALAHLLYGIEQGEGFIEVIGQIGTGKTTLCRTLLQRVGDDVSIACIFNPSGSETEMLVAVSREFGLPTAARSRYELIDELNAFLLEQRAAGRRAVLVVDEAQNLKPDVLEQLRLLSNMETEREKLIQIVLIGQPELEDNLNRPDMRQLRQRITVRWSLQPFSRAEVRDYLEHRLRVAGLRQPSLFTPRAVNRVYTASHGVPRLVNAIADRALLAGYSRGKPQIDLQVVRAAVRELPVQQPAHRRRAMGLPVGVAGSLMTSGLLIGLLYAAWGPAADLEFAAHAQLPAVAASRPEADRPMPAPRPETPALESPLEQVLSLLSPHASAAQALNALVEAWGYDARVKGEVDPERLSTLVREFSSLRVLSTRCTTERLQRVNLPAILELEYGDELRYVALLGMHADGSAVVALDAARFDLTRAELGRLWTGRTFYLWTNFEQLPALRPDMHGGAVRWLQTRLVELGYLAPAASSGAFDVPTAGALLRFQNAYSLEESGEAGVPTLIALYQALRYGAPQLNADREGS